MANYNELLYIITEGAYKKHMDNLENKKSQANKLKQTATGDRKIRLEQISREANDELIKLGKSHIREERNDRNIRDHIKNGTAIIRNEDGSLTTPEQMEEDRQKEISKIRDIKKKWMEEHQGPTRKSEYDRPVSNYKNSGSGPVTKSTKKDSHNTLVNKVKNSVKNIFKKESVDDLKLEIYESCHNGDITEEERNILLSIID